MDMLIQDNKTPIGPVSWDFEAEECLSIILILIRDC
jgi:hypothetical protein